MKYLTPLLAAYVLAAPLTDNISLDLTKTEWLDIWTYFIWSMSFVIWGFIVFAISAVATFLTR